MNGYDFINFYEKYALYRLADYLQVPAKMIEHTSEVDACSDYDLDFKGIKFDVKVAHPSIVRRNATPVWDFDIRKVSGNKRSGNMGSCHFYILVGMTKAIPQRVFLVPFNKAPTNHIRISIRGKSTYHQYQI